jgi:D-tyrosyl-tRNA(Tyr) deacylase
MRALLQRVSRATVDIGERRVGKMGPGLLILICGMQGDGETEAAALATKIPKLLIFADDDGRMNRSVLDTGGGVLAVRQSTLAADTSCGNRPGFSRAAPPKKVEPSMTGSASCRALWA